MIEKMSNWLTLDEASEYIGLGKTALYELARESKIPSNKVGKKWLFNKSDLDAWIRGNIPIEKFFVSVEANIEENLQLREPQIKAINISTTTLQMAEILPLFKFQLVAGNLDLLG